MGIKILILIKIMIWSIYDFLWFLKGTKFSKDIEIVVSPRLRLNFEFLLKSSPRNRPFRGVNQRANIQIALGADSPPTDIVLGYYGSFMQTHKKKNEDIDFDIQKHS